VFAGPIVRAAWRRGVARARRVGILFGLAVAIAACDPAAAPPTPPISAGSSGAPREVNIIAKDWLFLPDHVDLVPGETVLFHLVNGGLEVHEFVIGDQAVQDAWEIAEAATIGHPPGPTPFVSVAPGVSGLRVVVASGQRVDVTWTVPAAGAASPPAAIVVGCHIPGHWEKGMVVPITWVVRGAAH
jgi:uncharacterized cupredoxin-like copper-binding protein